MSIEEEGNTTTELKLVVRIRVDDSKTLFEIEEAVTGMLNKLTEDESYEVLDGRKITFNPANVT